MSCAPHPPNHSQPLRVRGGEEQHTPPIISWRCWPKWFHATIATATTTTTTTTTMTTKRIMGNYHNSKLYAYQYCPVQKE